ncbi:MAG: DUF3276 family protein, partial [Bacteroidota bacterium]|nr:DUF3276 family protein [Bacteroidota bacterium]
EQGKFFYEKFKIFLYKEDFEKFEETIGETIKFILKNNENNPSVEDIRKGDDEKVIDTNNDYTDDSLDLNTMNVNVEFEDLGNENE